jgi:hypothetical protein
VAACEALQCPTLYLNGFGAHRIEGIGDKHIPWIHNVRNTDVVIAIDDEDPMRLLRLFNEETGHRFLEHQGIPTSLVEKLPLLGISSISNLLSAIRLAKYYELDGEDVVFTVFTDSADMYRSRIGELTADRGLYRESDAMVDFHQSLQGIRTDWIKELNYWERKTLHNLKYFTWVEQQGKTSEELNALWSPEFWQETFAQAQKWDGWIEQFNQRSGVLERL